MSILRMSSASHFLNTGLGPHEVRESLKADGPGNLADAFGVQAVSLARQQVSDAVAYPPDDAVGQQLSQMAVDGRLGMAKDGGQLHQVDERHPVEGVEEMSFGTGHKSSLTIIACQR